MGAMTPREIVILGSTGSIGTQAIDVVTRNPDDFRVVGIGAGGGDPALLAAQALALGVEVIGVARSSAVQDLQLALYAEADKRGYATGDFPIPKILAGPEAMTELAQWRCDLVLNAITGSIGLGPTLSALRAGRLLALANKESLVAGGPLVRAATEPGRLIPVDSEHSALAQSLRGGRESQVRRMIVTASGGPFRGRPRSDLVDVTVEQALAHPTWNMGPVVTVNSATLVNKALEVIETHEFFGIPYRDITVVVHPQSIIHSMVEFVDGSTIAQVSPPDMRLPIAHALAWPDRVPDAAAPMDWTAAHRWSFDPLDDEAFPAVRLGRRAGEAGHCLPAVFNAANEECVAAFLAGRLGFLEITDTLEQVLSAAPGFDEPGTVEQVLAAEEWARAIARERIAARR